MTPTFRSTFFALLETYAPTLLAGPEARVSVPKPKLSAGQIGVFGVLGQNDWYADSDYTQIRARREACACGPISQGD